MCKTPNTERTPTIKPQTVKETILGQPAPIFSQACRKGPLHRRTTQCYQRRKSTQQNNTKILSKTKNGGRSHPRTTSTSLLFSGIVCRTGSNTKEQQRRDVIKDDKAKAPPIRQTKEVIPGLEHPLSSPGAWRRTPGRVRRGGGVEGSGSCRPNGGDVCHQRAQRVANNASGARQPRAGGGGGQGPGQPRYALPRDHR